MSEENKGLARRALEKIYGQGDLDAADEVYSPDYTDHDPAAPPEMTRGPDGVKQQASMYRSGFGNLQLSVEDQFADGDIVITRWTARGTQDGELMGISPTGNQMAITGITIARCSGGKIQEEWTNWDGLGMMQQLGAIPAEQPAG
jgi:predicted ester cyclase